MLEPLPHFWGGAGEMEPKIHYFTLPCQMMSSNGMLIYIILRLNLLLNNSRYLTE